MTTTLLAFVTGHENERQDYYAEFRVTFEVEPGDPSEFHERGYARGCPQVRPCFHLISAEAISIVLADRSHIFGADDALTDRALKHYIETQVHSA